MPVLATVTVLPGPAQAAAPEAQRAELRSGTAILRYGEPGDRRRAAERRRALRGELAAMNLNMDFFEALPMVAVRGSAPDLRAAARLPGVVAAHRDRRLSFELYQATPLVFGGRHEELAAAGFDGRGVNVAVVDSGVFGAHPDLSDHMVENFEVTDAAVQECPLQGNVCDTDENGHGTHVAGIAAGDGSASEGFHRGIAPAAGVVGYSVGVGPSILFAVAAYDHILAHPELGVVAVNSSFGVPGGGRFDSADPINQATKRLHAAGIVVVFSNGNSGSNSEEANPPGASDCSPQAPDGRCKPNPYSVAPWVMSAAGARKDLQAPSSEQHLSYYSARGDPDPQAALSGETIDYGPTLTAPGTNVRSARDPSGDAQAVALTGEPSALPPPSGGESFDGLYQPLTGTSMAAPALTGAVAVVQSAARARLGRLLSPAEVESVMTGSAQPMTGIDGFWDFPCGDLFECGSATPPEGYTSEPYVRWQVGAGYLDVAAAVDAVQSMPQPEEPTETPDTPVTPAATETPVTPATPAAACADRLAPRAGLRRARIRRTHRRVVFAGRATDRGCGPAGAGAMRGVRVAIARGTGRGQCRFAGRRGRLGAVRSCRRRRYLPAKGAVSWRLVVKGLPRGRYLAWARATDRNGNIGALEGPRRVLKRR